MFAVYIFLIGGVSPKVPQLEKERVQVQSLFLTFQSLYPQEEKKEDTAPPNINLIATSSGSIQLALAQVGGETMVLRVGSQIGQYKVLSVHRNYIMLSAGEKKIAVGFNLGPEEQTGSLSPSTAADFSSPRASTTLQATLSRGEIDRITADPGIMFRMIRLVPFVQEGRTRGFLFEWVEPGSIFQRAGIRAGDVLLSINNQEIRSGEDAFRILQMLRNESSIRLNLKRGDELIELSLRVE